MSFLLVTLALAVGIALTSGGSLRAILETRLRFTWALFTALALQLVLDLLGPWRGTASDVGHAVLVASYVLLLGFCAANLRLRGMAVVAIGIALNATVIALNQGMPVRTRGAGITVTVKHHPERPSDRLRVLGDIIVVRPLNQALSFGDLIMVVGLVDVLVHRSRAPLRTRRPLRDDSPVTAALAA